MFINLLGSTIMLMEQSHSKPLQKIKCTVKDANILVHRCFMGIHQLNSTN